MGGKANSTQEEYAAMCAQHGATRHMNTSNPEPPTPTAAKKSAPSVKKKTKGTVGGVFMAKKGSR